MADVSKATARVFVSYSSADKVFAQTLAKRLQGAGLSVWYAEWDIPIGSSIVEEVFRGVQKSDCLVVVLSSMSVQSRWCREELNVALMRRLSENDIRIVPVLIETCEIPTPLKHIRYADFREDQDEAFEQLLDALIPGHLVWAFLAESYREFVALSERLEDSGRFSDRPGMLREMFLLLESALNRRAFIEKKRARRTVSEGNMFDQIEFLAEQGLAVRSEVWNDLVQVRSAMSHGSAAASVVAGAARSRSILERFALALAPEVKKRELVAIRRALVELKRVMEILCFESKSLGGCQA